MNNLENSLDIRVNALFNSEIKKQLLDKSQSIYNSIQPQKSNDVFANLQNKLEAMKQTLVMLSDELIKIGNEALNDFEEEIQTVPVAEKNTAIENLRGLITEEIKEIVKHMSTSKFRE
ncbi:hypothetical protein DR871_012975 [Flavobacterium petrolei]|uniref:Uncharacterized protein n=1 Tax=Flavobacterium petrolei TaxID=2259594 RepID=A0A482TV02_9FLAO|nr:hypothetical protein [Flavobacterium petrolei]RYJ51336.1 hypothetical protein DR871_012975 [Flavobacterium petrolei]